MEVGRDADPVDRATHRAGEAQRDQIQAKGRTPAGRPTRRGSATRRQAGRDVMQVWTDVARTSGCTFFGLLQSQDATGKLSQQAGE